MPAFLNSRSPGDYPKNMAVSGTWSAAAAGSERVPPKAQKPFGTKALTVYTRWGFAGCKIGETKPSVSLT